MHTRNKFLILLSLLAILLSLATINPMVFAQSGVTDFTTVRVSEFFRAQPRASIIVTMNGTINPTGSIQKITAGGAVSVSGDNVTIKPAGTELTLVNVGSNTITITETANIKSAGNLVLGTLDTAVLVSDGADWYQVSGSNN